MTFVAFGWWEQASLLSQQSPKPFIYQSCHASSDTEVEQKVISLWTCNIPGSPQKGSSNHSISASTASYQEISSMGGHNLCMQGHMLFIKQCKVLQSQESHSQHLTQMRLSSRQDSSLQERGLASKGHKTFLDPIKTVGHPDLELNGFLWHNIYM